MIGPIQLKRAVKKVTGLSSVFLNELKIHRPETGACILYYHRIADIGFTDGRIDDRNVSPSQLEKQIAALSEFAEIVPLNEVLFRMENRTPSEEKPLVSLTFDDGYANFFSKVVPVLKKYGAHATLFVVTGKIASAEPAGFDYWARKNEPRVSPETWRMLNWKELEECIASGYVTLGAHSHNHLKANVCSRQQLVDEAASSAAILRSRFGKEHSLSYAYPFGNSIRGHVPADYENAVRDAGFEMAVTTDVGLASPDTNPFRLPRLEAHCMDTAFTLRAKANGVIAPLYCNDWFHRIRQRSVMRIKKVPA